MLGLKAIGFEIIRKIIHSRRKDKGQRRSWEVEMLEKIVVSILFSTYPQYNPNITPIL